MIIPYNTDAPIYHFPMATIGLITINAGVFFSAVQNPEQAEPWILHFGDGLQPAQWVSSNFLHADFLHLLGNMFFLWAFGLVVEGKLGWWKFLLLYLGICAIDGAIVQTVMRHSEGGALGASGVIFGLMAISLIWAPKNEMNCILIVSPLALARTGSSGMFDVPIALFCGLFVAYNLLIAGLTGFSISSEMLHLSGASVGAVLGAGLLKLGLVDCEGWDAFSVWAGKAGALELPDRTHSLQIELEPSRESPTVNAEKAQFFARALAQRLAARDPAGAAALYEKHRAEHPDWTLCESDLMALVKSLHEQKLWSLSVLPMVDYLRQFPKRSVKMRLKLAEILIVFERRPAKALKVLAKLDASSLPGALQAIHQKLTVRAQKLIEEGEVELGDDEDW